MTPLFLNLLMGLLGMPILLVFLAALFSRIRAQRGLAPLPPEKVGLIIILCSLASWVVTGINVVIQLRLR